MTRSGDGVVETPVAFPTAHENVWADTQAEAWGPRAKAQEKQDSPSGSAGDHQGERKGISHEQQKDTTFGTKEIL